MKKKAGEWVLVCERCKGEVEAKVVMVGGCLEQMHANVHYFCWAHGKIMQDDYERGRLYCQKCHAEYPPWDHLIPVADLLMEPL